MLFRKLKTSKIKNSLITLSIIMSCTCALSACGQTSSVSNDSAGITELQDRYCRLIMKLMLHLT